MTDSARLEFDRIVSLPCGFHKVASLRATITLVVLLRIVASAHQRCLFKQRLSSTKKVRFVAL
jgi:hypothetical protein